MSIQDVSQRNPLTGSADSDELTRARVDVSAGSTLSSFTIYILLPAHDILADYDDEGSRGIAPIQPGGRFLLYQTVRLGNDLVQIMLSLHEDAREGVYRIVGEVSARWLPSQLAASLAVDQTTYKAQANNGRVEFSNVEFPSDVKKVSVILKTIDEQGGSIS